MPGRSSDTAVSSATERATRDMLSPITRVTSSTPSSSSPASMKCFRSSIASTSSSLNARSPVARARQPERPAVAAEELDSTRPPRSATWSAVSVAVGAERALDRKQREPLLGDGLAQLLLGHPGVAELLEQGQPRLAIVALQPVQQTRGLEIHAAEANRLSAATRGSRPR